MLDAPLLFETGLNRLCISGTVGVVTSPEVQILRLTARDRVSRELAEQKIAAQMSGKEKVLVRKKGEMALTRDFIIQGQQIRLRY